MTEQEAAVAWLEQDYDDTLRLVTQEGEHDGQPVTHFSSSILLSHRGLMFQLKNQNG